MQGNRVRVTASRSAVSSLRVDLEGRVGSILLEALEVVKDLSPMRRPERTCFYRLTYLLEDMAQTIRQDYRIRRADRPHVLEPLQDTDVVEWELTLQSCSRATLPQAC